MHSHLLLPNLTNFHLLLSTCTHSYLFSRTPLHSHPLPLTLAHCHPFFTYSHSFSVTPTHSTHAQPTSIYVIPIPAQVQPLSSISSPYPNTLTQSNSSLTNPIFSPCVLHVYTNFNVNLFFLLFSVFFQKQLIKTFFVL